MNIIQLFAAILIYLLNYSEIFWLSGSFEVREQNSHLILVDGPIPHDTHS